MSLSLVATLFCDACGASYSGQVLWNDQAAEAQADITRRARDRGWVFLGRSQDLTLHLCPLCAPSEFQRAVPDLPAPGHPKRADTKDRIELATIRAAIISGKLTPPIEALFTKHFNAWTETHPVT